MANILQVTPPGINTDNRVIGNGQELGKQAESQGIHNPADPSRVMRADGQEEGKTQTATDESSAGIISYESNYRAFLRGLSDSREAQGLLKQMLLRFFGPAVQEMGDGGLELTSLLTMENREALVQFMKEQTASEALFSGPFFDNLRQFLSMNQMPAAQDAASAFLKAYTNYSAGPHLLRQLKTLGNDIGHMLLRQFQGEWRELLSSMDWAAPKGEIQANTQTLNGRLIPFLASYVSRTHDYGSVRSGIMLFIMHAVNYENGGAKQLDDALCRLAALMRQSGIPIKEEDVLLKELTERAEVSEDTGPGRLADGLAKLLAKGGQGVENVGQSQELLRGLLLNESVYMPLLHLILPFRIGKKEVVSELWIDPDAEKEPKEEGRRIKLFLKFDIQSLGSFELVMSLRDRQADIRLFVPQKLSDRQTDIMGEMETILKENGFRPHQVRIEKKKGEMRVEEIFPEIRKKERTVNVRI